MKKILTVLFLVLLLPCIANAFVSPDSIRQFIGHKVTVYVDFNQGFFIMTLKDVSDTELMGVPLNLSQAMIIPLDHVLSVEEMSDNFI